MLAGNLTTDALTNATFLCEAPWPANPCTGFGVCVADNVCECAGDWQFAGDLKVQSIEISRDCDIYDPVIVALFAIGAVASCFDACFALLILSRKVTSWSPLAILRTSPKGAKAKGRREMLHSIRLLLACCLSLFVYNVYRSVSRDTFLGHDVVPSLLFSCAISMSWHASMDFVSLRFCFAATRRAAPKL